MNPKTLSAAVLAAALSLPALADSSGNLLTGDAKLACEAIMCLSSANRPSECNESIHRYFTIQAAKPHLTMQARRNFLNQCPSSNEEGMPQLINALANGAGRCDAAELNRLMRATYQVKVCKQKKAVQPAGSVGSRSETERTKQEPECRMVTKSYIRNAKPAYCAAYHQHGWTTAGDAVRYEGEEKNGGRWVNSR